MRGAAGWLLGLTLCVAVTQVPPIDISDYQGHITT